MRRYKILTTSVLIFSLILVGAGCSKDVSKKTQKNNQKATAQKSEKNSKDKKADNVKRKTTSKIVQSGDPVGVIKLVSGDTPGVLRFSISENGEDFEPKTRVGQKIKGNPSSEGNILKIINGQPKTLTIQDDQYDNDGFKTTLESGESILVKTYENPFNLYGTGKGIGGRLMVEISN
ncbi:MAG: hypothetical protein ABEJ24_05760 [Candidatus Magasanikbacteria bacterium]